MLTKRKKNIRLKNYHKPQHSYQYQHAPGNGFLFIFNSFAISFIDMPRANEMNIDNKNKKYNKDNDYKIKKKDSFR